MLFIKSWAHRKSVWICASAPSMHAVITCTAMTKPWDWKSISRGHGRSTKEAGHSTLAINSLVQMKYVLSSCKTKWMYSTQLDRPQRLIQDKRWGYSRWQSCECHQVQKMACLIRTVACSRKQCVAGGRGAAASCQNGHPLSDSFKGDRNLYSGPDPTAVSWNSQWGASIACR